MREATFTVSPTSVYSTLPNAFHVAKDRPTRCKPDPEIQSFFLAAFRLPTRNITPQLDAAIKPRAA